MGSLGGVAVGIGLLVVPNDFEEIAKAAPENHAKAL